MEKTIENMDRNRLGILIRCLVILLITGVTNSAAVFVSPLAAHFNWTADAIANVSTTMLLCWTPGALIGGTLMSKIGARNAMLLGAVLFPLGTLTSSFVPQSSPWLLYVTFSFLQGLGNGLAYTVATYVSTGWYPDKRGLVSGLCMAFTGGSSAFLAPICSKLVQSTGIISTLRIVGLVSLVVCVVCALGVRQGEDLVHCAAQLECARALHTLGLDIHLAAEGIVERRQAQQRRLNNIRGNARVRRPDGLQCHVHGNAPFSADLL